MSPDSTPKCTARALRDRASRKIGILEANACMQREEAIRADAAGRPDVATRHRENAELHDHQIAAARADLDRIDADLAAGWLPPDQRSVEVLEHAHALHKRIGSRHTARVRRHVRRARAGRIVHRARGRRPSGRPRARRTAHGTRAGPASDDASGSSEPDPPGGVGPVADRGRT